MTISFKYGILPDDYTNDTKKPVIKVTLQGNSATPIDVIALLDSGADVSVIPKGLAEFLNLELGEKEESKGIGGKIIIRNSYMKLAIQGKRDEKYNFTKIPVQVGEDDNLPIIIGRAGFFDKFIIIIDEKHQKVKLKRHNIDE